MMKRFLCSVYLKVKHMLISVSEFNQIHLMDRVVYNGQNCFVNNAIRWDEHGNRLYDILPEALDENGMRKGWHVRREEFRKKLCWLNIENDLTYYYRWWKNYWYNIQLRQMLCESHDYMKIGFREEERNNVRFSMRHYRCYKCGKEIWVDGRRDPISKG